MIMAPEITAIAEAVKKILQDDAMNARKEQEVTKIKAQIDQINEDSNLKDVEKELHLAVLDFQLKRAELAYSDIEAAAEFAREEQEFNIENDVKILRINSQNGNNVIELRVPSDAMENFDELLVASTKYWKELTSKING